MTPTQYFEDVENGGTFYIDDQGDSIYVNPDTGQELFWVSGETGERGEFEADPSEIPALAEEGARSLAFRDEWEADQAAQEEFIEELDGLLRELEVDLDRELSSKEIRSVVEHIEAGGAVDGIADLVHDTSTSTGRVEALAGAIDDLAEAAEEEESAPEVPASGEPVEAEGGE
jgi:hypothetical protein